MSGLSLTPGAEDLIGFLLNMPWFYISHVDLQSILDYILNMTYDPRGFYPWRP